MPKIMVADRPISILHHGNRAYQPNKVGEWEIDDADVDGVRPHGLQLKEEAEEKKRKKNGDRSDEIAALKARIAELEAAGAEKK